MDIIYTCRNGCHTEIIIGTIGVTTVFAATGIKSAAYNNSKVYFDGKEIPLKNQLIFMIKDSTIIPAYERITGIYAL